MLNKIKQKIKMARILPIAASIIIKQSYNFADRVGVELRTKMIALFNIIINRGTIFLICFFPQMGVYIS